MREYLEALDEEALAEALPKKVSLTDPLSRWTAAPGGPAFFAYSTNYLIDTEHGTFADSLKGSLRPPRRVSRTPHACKKSNVKPTPPSRQVLDRKNPEEQVREEQPRNQIQGKYPLHSVT